jgi:hypothetical protein
MTTKRRNRTKQMTNCDADLLGEATPHADILPLLISEWNSDLDLQKIAVSGDELPLSIARDTSARQPVADNSLQWCEKKVGLRQSGTVWAWATPTKKPQRARTIPELGCDRWRQQPCFGCNRSSDHDVLLLLPRSHLHLAPGRRPAEREPPASAGLVA